MTFNFNNNLFQHFWNISYTLNNVDYVSHFMQNYHLPGFYMNIHTPVSLRELMLDFQPFPTNLVLKDRDYSSCTWRQMLIRPKIPTLHRGVPPPPIKLNRKLAKIQKSTFLGPHTNNHFNSDISKTMYFCYNYLLHYHIPHLSPIFMWISSQFLPNLVKAGSGYFCQRLTIRFGFWAKCAS